MKIILMGDNAYIDCKTGFLLCIGTRAEVEEASERERIELILAAMVWSKYRAIQTAKGLTKH